ncbi:MAG: hypothetical protein WBK77_02200 [Alphaproteobacteria bacterium]
MQNQYNKSDDTQRLQQFNSDGLQKGGVVNVGGGVKMMTQEEQARITAAIRLEVAAHPELIIGK